MERLLDNLVGDWLVRYLRYWRVAVRPVGVGLLLLEPHLHFDFEVVEVVVVGDIVAPEFAVVIIELVDVRNHQVNCRVRRERAY